MDNIMNNGVAENVTPSIKNAVNKRRTLTEDEMNEVLGGNPNIEMVNPVLITPLTQPETHDVEVTEDGTIKANVDHPNHYADGRSYEPIDVIEDWELGFNLGNAVKYISRAGRKDDIIQDLEKARWYLNREITRLRAIRNDEIG